MLERIRQDKIHPEETPVVLENGTYRRVFNRPVRDYTLKLSTLLNSSGDKDPYVENLLQESMITMKKSLDRIKMVVKLGPGLGLIGTLIPMGTGLAALGQGDMTKLSSDLVIAFTTTVVGLAAGLAAYFFTAVKQRWIEEDIKNIEFITELMTRNRVNKEDGDTHHEILWETKKKAC